METASDPKKSRPSDSYLKYSGLGLQLVGTIGVSAWLGHLLDQQLGLKFPAFLLSFVMLSFGGNMWLLYRANTKS